MPAARYPDIIEDCYDIMMHVSIAPGKLFANFARFVYTAGNTITAFYRTKPG